jgi:hypothetical protein
MADIEIGWRRQVSTENLPYGIDTSATLDVGDVIQAVSSTLIDLSNASDYPAGLTQGPTFVGAVITQFVGLLVAGHTYRLVVTATLQGQKKRSAVLNLQCPF